MVNKPKNLTTGILLFGLFLLVCNYFGWFPLFEGDADSARYLLSALSQSLAAIFALVFSITLIALQMIASRYSTKVYSVFFDKFFFAYAIVFILDIILAFLIIGKIRYDKVTCFQGFLLDMNLVLSFIILLLLIPFILRTKNIIIPETIIDITKKEIEELIDILNSERVSESWHESTKNAFSKIEVIRDISTKAAINREISVFRYSIRTWAELIPKSVNSPIQATLINTFPQIFTLAGEIDETISKSGIDELSNVIRDAVFREEEHLVTEGMNSLAELCIHLSSDFPNTVKRAMPEMRASAQMSIHKMPSVSKNAIILFRDIAGHSKNVSVQETAVREILNVMAQAFGMAIEKDTIKAEIISTGVHAYGALLGPNIEYSINRKVHPKINKNLYGVLYDFALPYHDSTSPETIEKIANEVLPLLKSAPDMSTLLLLGVRVPTLREKMSSKLKEFTSAVNIREKRLDETFAHAEELAREKPEILKEIKELKKNFISKV